MTHPHGSRSIQALSLLTLSMLLAVLLLPEGVQAALSSLPPRPPTPTAVPPRDSAESAGGAIRLQATQPQVDAWTAVEWQDALGAWHTVLGWQGSFDSMSNDTGLKTWWVALEDLGKGPFRWRVYQHSSGRLLASSMPFNLPIANRVTVTVKVTLAP